MIHLSKVKIIWLVSKDREQKKSQVHSPIVYYACLSQDSGLTRPRVLGSLQASICA